MEKDKNYFGNRFNALDDTDLFESFADCEDAANRVSFVKKLLQASA